MRPEPILTPNAHADVLYTDGERLSLRIISTTHAWAEIFLPGAGWITFDPTNRAVGGYNLIPKDRIVHVHVKDCHMEGPTPIWGPVGTRHVDWKGQIAALRGDGYKGWLSLETHWQGPGGNDKMAASTICGWNLRGLAAA